MSYSNYADSSDLSKKKRDLNTLVSTGADQKDKLAAQKTYSQIQNYGDFEYDVNGDALYQQYKDGYTKQGQLAMQDAIGKASTMTGGYGNSYAQQVGQQTFNGYMQALNDKIPELYALAYDKHNQGLNNLYKQYDLENNAYLQTYGEWMDQVGLLQSDIDSQQQIELADHTNRQNYNATVKAAEIEAAASAWEAQKWALENGYTYDTTTGALTKTPEALGADYATTLAPYIEVVSAIPTAQGRKEYIESLGPKEDKDGNPIAGSGTLSEEEAAWLGMNYYDSVKDVEEYIPLQDRDWKQEGTYGATINWWGGMNRDAMVIDQFDNVKTLGELYDDLEATIGKKSARKYILELQEEKGISGGWIW